MNADRNMVGEYQPFLQDVQKEIKETMRKGIFFLKGTIELMTMKKQTNNIIKWPGRVRI